MEIDKNKANNNFIEEIGKNAEAILEALENEKNVKANLKIKTQRNAETAKKLNTLKNEENDRDDR